MRNVKIDEIKAGDVLYPDGGFDCMRKNEPKEIKQDYNKSIYIECDQSHHKLSGQVGDEGVYYGLSREPWP